MKQILLLVLMVAGTLWANAQRVVKMRTMWDRPQVCVIFGEYKLYFTIQHIDKALALMAEMGDSTFGRSCGLDTAGSYTIELHPGLKNVYINPLQKLMQQGVGAFLLSSGRALVTTRKKKLDNILMDIQPVGDTDDDAYILFYDPRHHSVLFTGKMAVNMYKKDIGLD